VLAHTSRTPPVVIVSYMPSLPQPPKDTLLILSYQTESLQASDWGLTTAVPPLPLNLVWGNTSSCAGC
jgi:hypothetical protein